jgi:hypothetical protein
MSEHNHPWRKLTRGALAAASVAAVAVTTEALAQPPIAYSPQFSSCSRESQKLYATCADATDRAYQQHRRWVFRDANMSSSDRNYQNSKLNQERQKDLDSCRATADAYRTNCSN